MFYSLILPFLEFIADYRSWLTAKTGFVHVS